MPDKAASDAWDQETERMAASGLTPPPPNIQDNRQRNPIILRREVANWATRAFVLMAGIAGTMVVGYIVIPALSGLVVPVSAILLAAAWVCLVVMVVRIVQFLLARRTFYQAVSTELGASYAGELRRRERPLSWHRMTAVQRIASLLAVVVLGLGLARSPAFGQQNFALRAIVFTAITALVTMFCMRLFRH